MAKLRTAINGFGRIGRLMFRANLVKDLVDIVAINDPNPTETLAYLLKYDSTHGRLDMDIKSTQTSIIVNGKEIPCTGEKDPSKLPWAAHNIDMVFEATGIFTTKESASAHLTAGAKRVMITAPAKGVDATFVFGIDHETFDPVKHIVFSNASCTTNCLAPLAKVLNDNFGIVKGMMTTIHAYTNDQRTLDLAHKDLRRGRTAAMNIIPTTTGAASAIGEVLPELKGKLDGLALRVPVCDASVTDLVCEVSKPTTVEEVNAAYLKAAENQFKGLLEYCIDPVVSSDIIHNQASCVFDAKLTMVTGGNMIKVMGWYDNEWGYSNRLLDLAGYIASRV
jgi:glyceraldehyde 3-phosphate dehydrogenase